MSAKERVHPRLRTIYWQNFILSASLVLLTLLLLGATFVAVSYAYAIDERTAAMREKAQIVSGRVANYFTTGDVRSAQELAAVAASMTDVDFLIAYEDGQIVLTTDKSLTGQSLRLPQEVTDAVVSGSGYAARTSLGSIFPANRFVVGVPVRSGAQVVGVVLAVSELGRITTMWRAFFAMFVMTSVIVLLLSVAASAWVSMRQSRPIREMAAATRSYAQGNFSVRMQDYGAGEIGELAASFNSMADSIEETERQRREFIANVSHELKTPMTSIAGYTDGILDGTIPPEREREYLRIISDESRRLSRLVRRMLDISQLQSRDALRKAPFDLGESMRRALISLEKKITDRSLDVQADIPDEPVMVLGDVDLITQVVYNLLENAAKFAREGTTLYLGCALAPGKAVVSVRNLGDTIPREEIPLLFERFHKSDRSRSADKDGVGLGLYVVKTILEQHKESIAVTSEDGVTTFAFSMTLAS